MKFELKDNQAALILEETEGTDERKISSDVKHGGKEKNFVSFLCEAITEKLSDESLWEEICEIAERIQQESDNELEEDDEQEESGLLHPIVDEIIRRMDLHEHNLAIHEDIVNWHKKSTGQWELSEDETQLNHNVIENKNCFGKKFMDYARAEVKYHKRELKDARILFRIYMDTFNGGWEF
jgi:hypothetical protein